MQHRAVGALRILHNEQALLDLLVELADLLLEPLLVRRQRDNSLGDEPARLPNVIGDLVLRRFGLVKVLDLTGFHLRDLCAELAHLRAETAAVEGLLDALLRLLHRRHSLAEARYPLDALVVVGWGASEDTEPRPH